MSNCTGIKYPRATTSTGKVHINYMYITYTFCFAGLVLGAIPLPVTTSLAIKALSLGLGSILWLLPGNLLTGRGNFLAVLLEVLFPLALLGLSGFIHHQHLMFLLDFYLCRFQHSIYLRNVLYHP